MYLRLNLLENDTESEAIIDFLKFTHYLFLVMHINVVIMIIIGVLCFVISLFLPLPHDSDAEYENEELEENLETTNICFTD